MSDGPYENGDASDASLRLNESTETLHTRDPADYESTSTAVVSAVKTAVGCEMTDLPPLYDTVEPEALDRLAAAGTVRVRFRFAGCEVELSEDEVRVRGPSEKS